MNRSAPLLEAWLALGVAALAFIGFGILFTGRYRRYKQHGVVFPPLEPGSIRFHEGHASGHSHKSMSERLGGAGRCLAVTVTDTEVWLRLDFPFNVVAFAGHSDLECRIPRASIVSLQPIQSLLTESVRLSYRDEYGKIHAYSLKLRKRDEFMRVLGIPLQTV